MKDTIKAMETRFLQDEILFYFNDKKSHDTPMDIRMNFNKKIIKTSFIGD